MGDVTTTDSGLQYEVLASGSGATPGPTDTVSAHYHGTFEDGRVFDSSVDRGEPIDLPVNGVIAGWTEALQMMKEGDKWRLIVPSDLYRVIRRWCLRLNCWLFVSANYPWGKPPLFCDLAACITYSPGNSSLKQLVVNR